MKRCPFCAEEIQDTAVVCRFCGRELAESGARPLSADERRSILSRQIEKHVTPTMRVESRSDFQAVLVYGHHPNHVLHFLIGVFTLGLWWIVWLILALKERETRRLITVDEFGVARARDY